MYVSIIYLSMSSVFVVKLLVSLHPLSTLFLMQSLTEHIVHRSPRQTVQHAPIFQGSPVQHWGHRAPSLIFWELTSFMSSCCAASILLPQSSP